MKKKVSICISEEQVMRSERDKNVLQESSSIFFPL